MPDDNKTFHSKLNRRRVLQGLGGVGIAGLAGCSGGNENGADGGGTGSGSGGSTGAEGTGSGGSSAGGSLRIALVKSPIEFDPIVLNDVPSSQVVDRIVEGLYTYNEEGTGVVPALADGEPTVENDGTRYTVTIQENATFSNGDPVTASDVKYSFEAPVKEETQNASEVNMIDSITAVDEKTVQFDLKYPFGAFRNTLTWYVVPQSVREEDRDAFNNGDNLVGSGPFVFDEWQEGNFARISTNPDYWGEPKPKVSEVEFVPVEEATTRVTTLKNGENDVVEEIPPKQYPTVRNMSDVSIDEVPGVGYFYAAFNCKEGPTADPLVREGIDYAFSMDQAVSSYVEPTGVRQYSPYPDVIAQDWEFPVDQWSQIPHDKNVDQTKALFDEAGVPDDYSFRIIVPPDDKREQIGISISNGLQEAGWNANVQRLDWGAFLEQYVSGSEDDYNIYTLGWSGTPDPDAFSYYMFGATEDTLGVTDGTFYHDSSEQAATATEKFVEARRTNDQETRKQLYTEATTTVLEDRAHLPAYNLKNSFGVKNYVQDFSSHSVLSLTLSTDHNNVSINRQ